MHNQNEAFLHLNDALPAGLCYAGDRKRKGGYLCTTRMRPFST